MKVSRREAMRIAGFSMAGSAVLADFGCTQMRPEPKLLASQAPHPARFSVPLPIPTVLKPASISGETDYYEMSARPASLQILPGLQTEVWGYEGQFPGPTIEARVGRRLSLRLRNLLPVPLAHHLHGGHTPAESDGYPTDLVLPAGGFANAHMHDPRAITAIGEREYVYPNLQRPAVLWYHDHRMDFTGAQVWRGMAGLYILRDAAEDKLPLPRGEKEIPLVLCDRSFAADGSFLYPSLDKDLRTIPGVESDYMGGVLGDVILVNGAPWPRLEVSNTRYRFRILNASNSRRYELALEPVSRGGPSFVQIGSDGGLLDAPQNRRTIRIAPAERFDVIVDFSRYPLGSNVVMTNREGDGLADSVMQFHIARNEKDQSAIPARLSESVSLNADRNTHVRDFDFHYVRNSRVWTINGKTFDPARMDAQPKLGATEIWRLRSDFNHPVHLHLVQFRVLSHGGPAGASDAGWKDTLDLVPGEAAEILVRFTDYRGRYVFHCHNLEHEDMMMMGNFEVV